MIRIANLLHNWDFYSVCPRCRMGIIKLSLLGCEIITQEKVGKKYVCKKIKKIFDRQEKGGFPRYTDAILIYIFDR